MALKSEFVEALQRGVDHESLLNIVRRHKQLGLTQRETYDVLQEIWHEKGFDVDDGEHNPLRDNLEYVMEIVWGFCSAGRGIWDTSLTNASADAPFNQP